jgi:hypothetical protein
MHYFLKQSSAELHLVWLKGKPRGQRSKRQLYTTPPPLWDYFLAVFFLLRESHAVLNFAFASLKKSQSYQKQSI